MSNATCRYLSFIWGLLALVANFLTVLWLHLWPIFFSPFYDLFILFSTIGSIFSLQWCCCVFTFVHLFFPCVFTYDNCGFLSIKEGICLRSFGSSHKKNYIFESEMQEWRYFLSYLNCTHFCRLSILLIWFLFCLFLICIVFCGIQLQNTLDATYSVRKCLTCFFR